ncbi:MAG TPA: adenylate/guanylate cyclase domain-containing protein [Candidatus Acidoferrum sp.]|nr:adenylate/guanylate cyclase domain-containing protein [Candidatus Acidoferrum sp.]
MIIAICAICTALVYLWLNFETNNVAEFWVQDFTLRNGRHVEVDPRLVFIGIDQPNYADRLAGEDLAAVPVLAHLTNNFPWSRAVWAEAIDRIASGGARAIMLDLVLAAPGHGDDVLRAVLDKHRDRVVIAANISTFARPNEQITSTITFPADSVLSYADVTRPASEPRVGYVNILADGDGIMRRTLFRMDATNALGLMPPGVVMHSLAAQALVKSGNGHLLPRRNAQYRFRYTAPPNQGYRARPIDSLFIPSHWENNFQNGSFFKDKIVIIGPAANIFHDEHATPFLNPTEMLGPEIHLNIIAAALRGEFLGESSARVNLMLIALGGAFAWALGIMVRRPVLRLVAAVVCVAIYLGLCWIVFNYANLVLLSVSPSVALGLSSLAVFAYDFTLERKERQRTRRTLERYVSKDVVREVLDNPETYLSALGGVRRPVTILFSDVRGFTTLTEGSDPAALVMQLNEYFKEMVGIVFKQHGSLDKFIGDAVMALWGSITTEGVARDAENAVVAALEMRKSLAKLNINWKQRGMVELAFGIGINHGDVIVGNLGSEEKMEVSVIGDPVNLASRLESLTKEYKLDLLLGESLAALVRDRFVLRTVDSVQVKGKTKPVHVFTVMADKQAGEQAPSWLPRHEQGLESYRARHFVEASESFREVLRAIPDDYLTKLFLQRCEELISHPPPPEWDTVFVMKSK